MLSALVDLAYPVLVFLTATLSELADVAGRAFAGIFDAVFALPGVGIRLLGAAGAGSSFVKVPWRSSLGFALAPVLGELDLVP
mgnify:FL=1